MDAKELRIGNYVRTSYYHDTQEAKLDLGKDYSEDKEWMIDRVQGICHPDDDFLYYGELEIEEGTNRTKGIPLTEEWLLRFEGFKKWQWCDDCVYIKCNGAYLFLRKLKGTWLCYFKYINHEGSEDAYTREFHFEIKNPPKYVHQLQNLFFALTGEELKLKDNE